MTYVCLHTEERGQHDGTMEWNFLKTGRIKDILVYGSLLRCGDTYKFEKSRHLLARGSLSQTFLAKSHWTFCALRTLSVNAWSHRSLHWQSDFSMVWRRTRITTILTSRQGRSSSCAWMIWNILWWWRSCPTTNGGGKATAVDTVDGSKNPAFTSWGW